MKLFLHAHATHPDWRMALALASALNNLGFGQKICGKSSHIPAIYKYPISVWSVADIAHCRDAIHSVNNRTP